MRFGTCVLKPTETLYPLKRASYRIKRLTQIMNRGMSVLNKWKIDPLSLVLWILCSIFLLLVQFGYISPVGIIIISYEQYVWVFWISVFAFILSTGYFVSKIPRYARWSIGYTGEIIRTVRDGESGRDYFIRGKDDTPLKEVLHKRWPFEDRNRSDNWYVVDESGNDVTSLPLSSLNGTVTVLFFKED
jgi:hypothetical protein